MVGSEPWAKHHIVDLCRERGTNEVVLSSGGDGCQIPTQTFSISLGRIPIPGARDEIVGVAGAREENRYGTCCSLLEKVTVHFLKTSCFILAQKSAQSK